MARAPTRIPRSEGGPGVAVERGVLLGAATALALWAIDAARASLSAAEIFDDRAEQLRFLGYSLGQLLGAGVLAGAGLGAIAGAIALASTRLVQKARATTTIRDRLTSALLTALLAPFLIEL